MALKPCKECGKDVSTEANTCPNCGVPPDEKKNRLSKETYQSTEDGLRYDDSVGKMCAMIINKGKNSFKKMVQAALQMPLSYGKIKV
jgi:uncharacterized membrane protein YvbJ